MEFKPGDFIQLIPVECAKHPNKNFFSLHKDEVFCVVGADEYAYIVEPGNYRLTKAHCMAAI